MNVLGVRDEAERQHELAELDGAADAPGPLRALAQATDLATLQRAYEAALTGLEERVAKVPANDPQLGYLRALLVLTKKVELELGAERASLARMYRDLEEIHDFTHEIYPAKAAE
jgi:hypothetical protein